MTSGHIDNWHLAYFLFLDDCMRPLDEKLGNGSDECRETHQTSRGFHWGLPVQISAKSVHGKLRYDDRKSHCTVGRKCMDERRPSLARSRTREPIDMTLFESVEDTHRSRLFKFEHSGINRTEDIHVRNHVIENSTFS